MISREKVCLGREEEEERTRKRRERGRIGNESVRQKRGRQVFRRK